MSTTIKLRCIDQVLTFEGTPTIASGGVREDFLSVEFCSKWDGATKTAVFWRTEADAYHVPLAEDNTCVIPWEVLTEEGAFYFGLFGVYGDGRQRTSEVIRYTVAKGAITSGTKPSDPTPDIYTQLLAQYQELHQELGRRPNPNLLHNWYFANPVNQRGQAVYPAGEKVYTIDRWYKNSSIEVAVNEGSITITNTGTVSSSCAQPFANIPPAGAQLTFSALTADGVLYSGTKRMPVTQAKYSNFFTTDEEVSARVYSAGDDGTPARFQFVVPVGASLELSAVKLELGSVQTLAHQDSDGKWVLNELPDYGEELAKCQRYYQLFSSEDKMPTALADYRPAMRATPATGTISIDGVTYYYADANP